MVDLVSKKSSTKRLAYPSTCGDVYSPAWVQFTIKERKGAILGKTRTTIGLYMPESAALPSTTSWENFQAGLTAKNVYGHINNALANAVQAGQTYDSVAAAWADRGSAAFKGGEDDAKKFALDTNFLKGVIEGQMTNKVSNIMAATAGRFIKGFDGAEISTNEFLGMTTGVIRNPYLTAIFRGVDFRTFEFSFRFFPHNEEECYTIYKIIEEFRMAALPSIVNTGSGVNGFMAYPMAFEIGYKWGTKDNNFIHRFKPSVLTAVDLSYTGNGSWTVMRNGMPSSIILNLRFSETEIVTRGDVPRDGDNGGY